MKQDIANLTNNSADFEKICRKYTQEKIRYFLAHESGEFLGNHNYAIGKPATYGNVADIRRVFGSVLNVTSANDNRHPAEDTKLYCDLITSNVYKKGFIEYTKEEAFIAYYCKNYC